ncbi:MULTISPECIES: DUF2510 domain-containing protein [unclassified Leucobacter]|uniref:DUF2510 domain-containing protein n=1 Tax=unclassified Leucobacter TaxID=2621730 RepID=UPI0006229B4C|nr:DUF2510 domain-containing protein [Leucobacter sp. Ag1]KKI22546.1 hypothetical protein XM48_01210 [Leucobacter sp. Ag1]
MSSDTRPEPRSEAGWWPTQAPGVVRWWDGDGWTDRIMVKGRETTIEDRRSALGDQLFLFEITMILLGVAAVIGGGAGFLPAGMSGTLVTGFIGAAIAILVNTRQQQRRLSRTRTGEQYPPAP